MNYQKLKKHIIALATLPETESPVISAYFAAGTPRSAQVTELNSWPAVIDESIQSFLDQANRDSHDAVRLLDSAVRRGGLAVVGLQQSIDALEAGQADLLVLADDLPEPDREKLVRHAVRHDTRIETVRGSSLLARNGGAGCLLRYLTPTVEIQPVAV